MRKLEIKKVFESKRIDGMLSRLCNIRDAICFQDRLRKDNLIDTFVYNFEEVSQNDLFQDDDRIYVIQTASNYFIEIEKEDLEKFNI